MQIKSLAGEFDITVNSVELEGSDLVVLGNMGVWEARTHIARADVMPFVRNVVFTAAFWKFLLALPFGRRRCGQIE